jgi:hypothetical protein
VPMVMTGLIVAGVSLMGMIFGPWKQYSMSSLKTSYTSSEAMEAFTTEPLSVVSHVMVLFVMIAEESELKGKSVCMLHESGSSIGQQVEHLTCYCLSCWGQATSHRPVHLGWKHTLGHWA